MVQAAIHTLPTLLQECAFRRDNRVSTPVNKDVPELTLGVVSKSHMKTQSAIPWMRLAALAILTTAPLALALEIKPTRHELHAEKTWLKEHLLDCKLKPSPTKL